MTKFKKIILYISILTVSSILSINCNAMKNNDIKNSNTINNKEKQTQNPSNNNFIYNPFYGENFFNSNKEFLNKKRNLKNKDEEKNLEIKSEENSEKPNIKNLEEKNLEIKSEENSKKPNIKNLEEKNNENKNIINNNIEKDSEEESLESYEDEMNDEHLIDNIKEKSKNLGNILNNINEQKNNLFIFFKIYVDYDTIKKMNQIKIKICKEILCYLIDKKMSKKTNWNSHLNKYLLKDSFEKYSDKNSFILGFCVSLKDNFMFPVFDSSEKENAQNILEDFIKSFEDSKTKILRTCSNENDILNLKKNEFIKVMTTIFDLIGCSLDIDNDEDWIGDSNYITLNEEIIKKIEKIEKEKTNLKEGIKEIHNYISNFLEQNKENIDNLKYFLSNKEMQELITLNNKMLDIFKYQNGLKKGFSNLKNEFEFFINNYYKDNFRNEDKKVFSRILKSLTLKELHELINNIYSFVDIKHIDSDSKPIDYIDLTYPVRIFFNFKLDILPKKDKVLVEKFMSNTLKLIKKDINNNLYNKKYIFGLPYANLNNEDKTFTLKINVINPQDIYSNLFFYENINWHFKKDVVDFWIIKTLKEKMPDCYADNLVDTYKKIIKDQKIDIKTLDMDKFLEETKNYSLDEYSKKVDQNNIYNIDTDEEKNFYIKLSNKIKENYIEKNKNINSCLKNIFIYAYVGFQIDFMMETLAKNLKDKYSELIEEILTKAKINHNEKDYEIITPDSKILKLLGDTPQKNYSFNFKLLLRDALYKKKIHIDKILENEESNNVVIEKAVEKTIKELKEMPELEFNEKIKNHFEKNKENIEKYFERKNLTIDEKNEFRNILKNFVDNMKKENLYIDYLTKWKDLYEQYIYFIIKHYIF